MSINTDLLTILEDYADSDIDGVVLTNELTQKYFNLVNPTYRRLGLTKDHWMLYSPAFFYPTRSVLKKPFDEKLELFREVGLIKEWIRRFYDSRTKKSNKKGPMKLRIANIMAPFQMYVIMLFISSIVFILEIFSVKCVHVKYFIEFLTY